MILNKQNITEPIGQAKVWECATRDFVLFMLDNLMSTSVKFKLKCMELSNSMTALYALYLKFSKNKRSKSSLLRYSQYKIHICLWYNRLLLPRQNIALLALGGHTSLGGVECLGKPSLGHRGAPVTKK